MMGMEDILDEAIAFSQMEAATFGGDDSSSVLAAMLEDREAVEQHLVDVIIFVCQKKSKNSAHDVLLDAVRFRDDMNAIANPIEADELDSKVWLP